MSPEQLFSIVNAVALISWIALAALPRVRWIAHALAAVWVPSLLAVVYLALIAVHIGGSSGGFSTLAAVAQLFSNPWLLLAGWVHYLAFDLFVGSWEVRDAQARGISHWLVVPCLALTFLFGPIGFLTYRGLRLIGPAKAGIHE
jgi:hypothetical protein